MSGSGNQPNQGSGQSQGGEPRGQPQSGHQQNAQSDGGYGQPQQGGSSESAVDALQRPGPQTFMKGIGILSGAAGAVFGIMMMLVMKVGGFPILPGAVQQARNFAAAAGAVAGAVNTGLAQPQWGNIIINGIVAGIGAGAAAAATVFSLDNFLLG